MTVKIDSNKLRSIRVRAGKTQKDLAQVIRKTEPTYSRKERGLDDFALIEAKEITDYLNEIFMRSIPDFEPYKIEDIFF